MAEPEITYCDDYEAITGQKIPATVETKVVGAPKSKKADAVTVAEVG